MIYWSQKPFSKEMPKSVSHCLSRERGTVMKNRPAVRMVVSLALTFLLFASAYGSDNPDAHGPVSAIRGLSPPFVENQGQAHPDVAFHVPLFNGTFQVTRRGEMHLQFPPPGKQSSGTASIREVIQSSSPVRVHRGRAAPTRVSYFLGKDPGGWRSGLPTYQSVVLDGFQSGVKLELHAGGGNIEKRFLIQAGGDPESVLVRVSGVAGLATCADGRLAVDTGNGVLHLSRPVACQMVDGAIQHVDVAYRTDGDAYGFRVGCYDRTRELVIDPLYQSTYLGGGNNDYINAMAVDPATFDVYVAGLTDSIIPGGPLSVRRGHDAFVARLSPDLTELLSLTYLGGAGTDEATALTFLPSPGGSDVYVAGYTDSDDFAGVTAESAQSTLRGAQNAFIAWFPADLADLQAASYFGGSSLCDGAFFATTDSVAIVKEDLGDTDVIYMAGTTTCRNLPGRGYPVAQSTCGGGGADGYVTAFDLDLTDIIQTTYVGGSGMDRVWAMTPAIGRVFVAGDTTSDDLPGVAGNSSQPARSGEEDAFIARLDAGLGTFERSTYFGGSGSDSVSQLVYGGASFILAGNTNSTDLPMTAGALQETPNDVYLARIFSTLDTDALGQTTYLGGSGDENLQDIAYEDSNGYFYLVGSTESADFPGVLDGNQETLEGTRDAFIIRMTGQLTPPELSGGTFQATYLGGPSSPEEIATAVALSNHLPVAAV